MPRKYSLKRKKDFENLFRKGFRKSSKNFSIVFNPAKYTKVGFIVRKKDIPKSTGRTYSKRIVREILTKEFLSKISTPIHLAITAKTNLRDLINATGFDEAKTELVNLLNEIDFSRLRKDA